MDQVAHDKYGNEVKIGDTIVYRNGSTLHKIKVDIISKGGSVGYAAEKWDGKLQKRVPSITYVRGEFIKV